MSFAALQAAWAQWLIEALIASGVRRAVISPGSRSTPLVLAAVRAESTGRLAVAVILDERSAGFFALGQSRATNEPSLLICTSGTAGAHYLPAVIEAAESRTPLIVLTADRPPELRGRGASQTTEQAGLFRRFVRRATEIGLAEGHEAAIRGLVRSAWLATQAAYWPDPGPVHLNAPFRKPLEPAGLAGPELEGDWAEFAEAAIAALPGPFAAPRVVPDDDALDAAVRRIQRARRPLLVLGPMAPAEAPAADAVAAFASAAGLPVLAEATAQHRFGSAASRHPVDISEPVFGSATFRERGAPDLVVQVGGAPTGRNLGEWISSSDVARIVFARHGIPEAFNQAGQIIVGDLDEALREAAVRIQESSVDSAWREELDRTVERAREIMLADEGEEGSRIGQGEVARAAVAAVPPGGILVVGNSMPVRDVDLHVPAAARGITVLSQRGVAGIDGLISGAAGAASATGRPTLLLLGDVSFQHDVGGLAAASTVDSPLVVLVVNNGGGRLFELLPVRRLEGVEPTFERFFLTPPEVDITAAAAAFGVPAAEPREVAELEGVLADAMTTPGATVVEVEVEASEPPAVRRIAAALEAELAADEGCFRA